MRITRRTTAAVAVAAGLVLTACGTSDDAGSATGDLPAATAASAEDAATPDASQEPAAEPAAAPADSEPADAPAASGAPAGDAPAASEAPADDAPAAEAPAEAAGPAEAQLGGRSFASELDPASAFDGNIFPDLLVDDIRAGNKINVANIFPAERPVLIWLWAPH